MSFDQYLDTQERTKINSHSVINRGSLQRPQNNRNSDISQVASKIISELSPQTENDKGILSTVFAYLRPNKAVNSDGTSENKEVLTEKTTFSIEREYDLNKQLYEGIQNNDLRKINSLERQLGKPNFGAHKFNNSEKLKQVITKVTKYMDTVAGNETAKARVWNTLMDELYSQFPKARIEKNTEPLQNPTRTEFPGMSGFETSYKCSPDGDVRRMPEILKYFKKPNKENIQKLRKTLDDCEKLETNTGNCNYAPFLSAFRNIVGKNENVSDSEKISIVKDWSAKTPINYRD